MGEYYPTQISRPASAAKVNRSQVFWDGHDAGLAGHLIEVCKFAPGSEDFVTWRDGWEGGHADWAAKPKNQNGTKAPTEIRKRGRRAADNPPATALERDEAAFRGTDQPAAE